MFDMHDMWEFLLEGLKNRHFRTYLTENTILKDMVYYGFCDSLVIILEGKNSGVEEQINMMAGFIERDFENTVSCSVIVVFYQ